MRVATQSSLILPALLVACAAVALSSCAFAPSSDTDGQGGLPTAGVSDYAVAGLRICAAGKIVLPADGQLTGFCMTGVSEGRLPCAADSDCLERETCICGQCRLTPCTNVECAVGLRCDGRSGRCLHTCPIPTSCGDGAACYDGFCMPICADDYDCAAGESCGTVPCDSDAACPVGDACDCEGKEGGACTATGTCARQYCLVKRCKSDDECRCESGTGCDEARYVGCTGEGMRLAGPAVLATDSGASMLVESRDADGVSVILRADSTDGLTWEIETAPILAPDAAWEGSRVGSPSAFFDGGQVVLYYAGGDGAGVGIAVSDDGLTWRKYDGNPVFAVQGSGSERKCSASAVNADCPSGERCYGGLCLARWERGRVNAPSVLSAGGTYLMFYEGGQGEGIGLATSKDGLSFEKYRDDPVLTGDQVKSVPTAVSASVQNKPTDDQAKYGAPWYDITAIGSPTVAVESLWDGTLVFRMWFAALGKESLPNPTNREPRANWSIGYAASTNAVAWKVYAYNPVFDHLVLLNHLNETEPSVLKLGDLYYMYYADPDNGGLGAGVSGLTPQARAEMK